MTYIEPASVGPSLGQGAGAVQELRQEIGQVRLLRVPSMALGCCPRRGICPEGLAQVPGQGMLCAPDGRHVAEGGERSRNSGQAGLPTMGSCPIPATALASRQFTIIPCSGILRDQVLELGAMAPAGLQRAVFCTVL